MIKIIDYGLGNISAFLNTYKRLNIPVSVAKTVEDLQSGSKLILPGVGSFDHAMTLLNNSGMRDCLDKMVKVDKIPILGVCVGMQILANRSEEGNAPGLGWIKGSVKHFRSFDSDNQILPHMGWNDIHPKPGESIFTGLQIDPFFYFLHSYYFECANEINEIAHSVYGKSFSCCVREDNIYGVQFHPEKSHNNGQLLLKNFSEI